MNAQQRIKEGKKKENKETDQNENGNKANEREKEASEHVTSTL